MATPISRLALIAAAASALSCASNKSNVPPGSTPCTAIPSKTPRAPKLLWSCERANMLEKLRTSNHPQWQELVASADRTGTSSERYGDNGGFAALVYQATGDVSYAKKSYAAAMKELSQHTKFDFNYTRAGWAEYAIIFDYLQGALSDDERKAMSDILYGWADQFFALDPKTPIRTTDTDQTTGNYFGILFTALATEGDARAEKLLSSPFVGGYDATAADLTTLRNAVHKYVTEWAVGGQWIESGYYDVETLQLLAMGVEALRNATGTEHFPEYAAFAEQVVRAQIAQWTPDLKTVAQWGDTESARDPEAWRRYQTLGMYTATLAPDSTMRPFGTAFTNKLKEVFKNDPIYQSRYYYYFDPTAPTMDYAGLPNVDYASGQGILLARTGWDTSDSLAFMHMRRAQMGIDHELAQFGCFQLYRKGAWAVTRPIGYGGGAWEPVSDNTVVIAGLDAMPDRGVVAQSSSADYAYLAGTTKGPRYLAPYYDPPPAFVTEWTRSTVYLPTTGKTADSFVVYDRVDAVAPTKLDRFTPDDQKHIQGAPKLKQWILHAVASPTVSASGATWTAAGQSVALTTLAPAHDTKVVDENTLGWQQNFPPASERHFYVAVTPKTDQAYDTFLNVVQVSDAAIATAPVRVASGDGAVEGALLARPGQKDAVVLFSAARGARVRTAGFSVNVTFTSDGGDVYVADLDPSKKWKLNGDDLAVDNGFGHGSISGSGAKTVTLSAE